MVDWRTALHWRAQLEALIEAVPPDQLCDLAGELAKYQARVILSLNSPPQPAPNGPVDRQLTVAEVADLLAVSRNWVYQNRKKLGGVKLGGSVRFPSRLVRRYLAAG